MAKQVPPALIVAVIVVILGIIFVGYKALAPQVVHVAPGTKIPPMPPRPHQ